MVILLICVEALVAFALVLDENYTLSDLRARIAENLSLAEGAAADLVLTYERDGVLCTIKDGTWNVGPLCALSLG
jgi:hypothetical protein